MVNARDISVANLKLKVLLYGKSGTLKTTFACFFPKPYVFDFDDGMLGQRGKDVEYDTITDYDQFEFKLVEFERSCQYETLILDSVTTMQEHRMNKILLINNRKMPTMNEWNVLIAGTIDIFMRLTKINKHLVVIAHEQLLQDEITGEIMYRPIIAGKKTPERLPLWFDECYRTQVIDDKDGKRVPQIITSSSTKFTAKSRLGLEPIVDWGKDNQLLDPYQMLVAQLNK